MKAYKVVLTESMLTGWKSGSGWSGCHKETETETARKSCVFNGIDSETADLDLRLSLTWMELK